MIVEVAGTRDIDETLITTDEVELAIRNAGIDKTQIKKLIHGGAIGIDTIADSWARANKIPVQRFRPDWTKGKVDALRRNYEMSDIADRIVFIWDGSKGGTEDNIKYVKTLGKPYFIHKIAPLDCYPCKHPNTIFVYGSNEKGQHGRGAAYHAMRKHGAKYGKVGFSGQSYGICTKDRQIKSLSLQDIKVYVDAFIRYTKHCDKFTYYITNIGTGLAGFKDEEIAPLFKNVSSNCILSEKWTKIIKSL